MQRVHVSWFICAMCSGIILGTLLCLEVKTTVFIGISWLITATALLLIALIARLRVLLILALVAGMLVGLQRGSTVQGQFAEYKPYYTQTVSLQGRVVEDASYGVRGDQRLRVGHVMINGTQLAGEVWVSLAAKADIKRGDTVRLGGRLNAGFGNLQATMFQAELQETIRPQPGDIGRQFRDWFAAGIARAIPEPQVSLGNGYLLGQKTALPETLEQQIRTVGLTHVVVASGYNLMILVVFARKALNRLSKYLATLAGGSMIIGFMLITGLSPSMSRAGLVAGLGLLVWYYGRIMHPVVLLTFAAAVTLLFRPAYVWGDVGWFLSFTSFAGILLLAPLLHSYFWGTDRLPGITRDLFVTTLSAQLMTLPIIMFVFEQYAPYALLANLLVLPVVPFAMLFTFMAGAGSLALPALASVFGLPATALLTYSTYVIDKVAKLPGAQGDIKISSTIVIISYLIIMLIMAYLWRVTRHNFRGKEAEQSVQL